MSNNQLQYSFAKALLDPDTALPPGLVAPQKIDIKRRFSVYRNNVVSSLVSALKTAFPTVMAIVGEEFFGPMAAIFVRKHPPSSPILMLYGEKFPVFLQGFEPLASLAYLPDVARLEQMRRQVYHAADAPSLPPQAFTEIPENDLNSVVLSLHPASEFTTFQNPAVSIWNWNNAEELTAKPEIPLNGEDVLVWRINNEVRMRLLSPGVEHFFKSIKQGNSLGESIQNASAINGFDLTEAFTTLIETRLVTAINRRS